MRNSSFQKHTINALTNAGFTLIELVMVIVLLGILSIGAQSLFNSKDAYVDYVLKERILSMGLLAQQMALSVSANPLTGAAPATMPASLTISRPSADSLNLSLSKHGTVVQTYSVEQPIPLTAIDASFLMVGMSSTLNWNIQAEMSDGLSHSVLIIGEQNFSICFSSSGYVYEC